MNENELPRIRTYESDVAEALKNKNVSRADIAIAEDNKRLKQSDTPTTNKTAKILTISTNLTTGTREPFGRGSTDIERLHWKTIALSAGILIFFSAIGIGAYYGYLWSTGAIEKTILDETPAQESTGLKLQSNDTRAGAIKKIKDELEQTETKLNEIKKINILVDEKPISPTELLRLLQARAPSALTRAFESSTTIGIHNFKGNQTFIIIPVSSFEQAFENMLIWEKDILEDIGPIFNINTRSLSLPQGTTTTATIPQIPALKDVIIKNKNARALFDKDGTITFLYSFTDNKTLIITTNDETMKALLPRASMGQFK